MNKDPSIHSALLRLDQFAIEMMDRIHDQDLDMLLMYDQDVLNQLVFAVKECLLYIIQDHLSIKMHNQKVWKTIIDIDRS